MKYYNCVHQFKYTWDQVASSFWSRYPNPNSTHVLSEDVLSRYIGEDGCLYSKRLITKTNSLPKWAERFVPGPKQVQIIEESIVNPKTKTFITYTKNIGMTKVMSIEEKCVYSPSQDSSAATACHKHAWISSGIMGFSGTITHFGYQRFKRNELKASQGFEFVLNNHYGVEETEETVQQLHSKPAVTKREKLKEKAEKAKEMAKEKAASVVVTN